MDAAECFIKSYKILTGCYENNHLSFFTYHNNVAYLYSEMGEYTKAIDNAKAALKIAGDLFGDGSVSVASACVTLSSIYDDYNQHENAIMYQIKALEIRRAMLNENSIDIAISYNSLAISYARTLEYGKSLQNFMESLAILEHPANSSHPFFAMLKKNMDELEMLINGKTSAPEFQKLLRNIA
jgi:tetratricopeptide (TPR) repeat protein